MTPHRGHPGHASVSGPDGPDGPPAPDNTARGGAQRGAPPDPYEAGRYAALVMSWHAARYRAALARQESQLTDVIAILASAVEQGRAPRRPRRR